MKTTRQIEDPIMSPQECCREAGISISTWRRAFRPRLAIVYLSPRRLGVRRSAWLKLLDANTEPAELTDADQPEAA